MHETICGTCGEAGDGEVCTACQEEMCKREQAICALLAWHHAVCCAPWSRLAPPDCRCGEAEAEYRDRPTQELLYAADYVRRLT